MKVEFYRHQLDDNILNGLKDVFGSVFLTTGPVTGCFEDAFSRYLDVDETVGLTSCTAGLFLCLKAWGIGSGDEVIVPAMTFVATANAVLHAGATPIFADVEDATGLMDLDDAERKVTERTRAVIPVHLYGRMVDINAFRDFADRHGLRLLEDAAHCVEGMFDGIRPGQLGDAACFSFYATKNITCGEGGAVVTNDKELADKIKILRLHGLDRDAAKRYHSFRHVDMIELGWKFNMNDIQAAMLLPQLDTVDERLRMREHVSGLYASLIGDSLPVTLMTVPLPGLTHALHLCIVRVASSERENLIGWLTENGVGVTVNYRAVHLNSYYRSTLGTHEGMCPVAESMGEEVLSLPFYPTLDDRSVEYVASVLSNYFEKERS